MVVLHWCARENNATPGTTIAGGIERKQERKKQTKWCAENGYICDEATKIKRGTQWLVVKYAHSISCILRQIVSTVRKTMMQTNNNDYSTSKKESFWCPVSSSVDGLHHKPIPPVHARRLEHYCACETAVSPPNKHKAARGDLICNAHGWHNNETNEATQI